MIDPEAIARELVAVRLATPIEAIDLLATHGDIPVADVAEVVTRANQLLARAATPPF